MTLRLAHRICSQEVKCPDGETDGLTSFLRQEFAKDRLPVIVADNVAKFWATSEKDGWSVERDFPNCAPPFEQFFIEWLMPPELYTSGNVTIHGCTFTSQHGFYFRQMSELDRDRLCWGIRRNFGESNQKYVQEITEAATASKWQVMAHEYVTIAKNGWPVNTKNNFLLFVDESGLMFKHFIFPGPTKPANFEIEMLVCHLHPALLAINFMHCKNVSLDAANETVGPKQKWLRRMKQPEIRYATINIEPMKRVLRTEGQSDSAGLKRAVHICRGHFKTYSEDGTGLFGSGRFGTFWVPSHAKGSAKEGKVVSGYDVRIPKQHKIA
jgi:hypothetical protein